jgi:predicted RNA binding protein YcfA (HicA-like mRNA interferase family)
MRSREVLKLLRADGWFEVGQDGSHLQLKHPIKSGRTTLPHPKDHIPIGTLKNIERQSGVQLRGR